MTQEQYYDAIGRAGLTYADEVLRLCASEARGCAPSWLKATCWLKLIKLAQFFYLRADYTSPDAVYFYNAMLDIAGTGYSSAVPDVNAQTGNTILTLPVLQNYNNDAILFTTTNDNPQLILQNYNLNYKPLYGNNPDLAPYIIAGGLNTGDEQTPPIITRSDPDDPNSDILQIVFDYPVATTGYLRIAGVGSTLSGNAAGSITTLTFFYDQDDLLEDDFGGYYLPLVLPGNKKPYYASLNGQSIPINYDKVTQRFSGFANNETCTIEISLI